MTSDFRHELRSFILEQDTALKECRCSRNVTSHDAAGAHE